MIFSRAMRGLLYLMAASVFAYDAVQAQAGVSRLRLEPLVVYVNAGTPNAGVPRTRPWHSIPGAHVVANNTFDVTQHWHPVGAQHGLRRRALTTATLQIDLDSAGGWKGLSALASAVSLAGADQTNTLGAANGGTSIDAVPFRGLGEAWIAQTLMDGALRIKAGRIDGNTEFAAAANAAPFLRPGSGLDPTLGPVMPTYPAPALGIAGSLQLSTHVRLSGGVFDGRPAARAALAAFDEATIVGASRRARFNIAQIDFENRHGRIGVGMWRHTANFAPLLEHSETPVNRDLSGFYAVADRTLATIGRSSTHPDGRAITAFAQLGIADRQLSDVRQHASVGVNIPSPLRPSADDAIGVVVSSLALGESGATVRQSRAGARETHLELLYTLQAFNWLALVPDLQFITSPVGRVDDTWATAATLRFIVTR